MHTGRKYIDKARAFMLAEDGVASISFVVAFPVFMLFFGMIFENGMISARHVMLERGVDIAVRDVRVGRMPEPTPALLRERICDVAQIIPDCENQLQLEMVTLDLRAWNGMPADVQCIDRSVPDRPITSFTPGGNNQLVFLRACARFDPVMPGSGIGYAISNSANSAAGGSYALIATSSYVVEPFRREDD
jgi:hypothetical protein